MIGTAGKARVRPTRVILYSLLRCGVFLSKGIHSFVEEVPLVVPENPISESGPAMEGANIHTWDRSGVVDLAVSTASTPYHREDLHFQKLWGSRGLVSK